MKIERLNILKKQIEDEFEKVDVRPTIYFRYKSKWHELGADEPCSELLAKDIDKSTFDPIAHHASSSLDAWFYIEDQDISIRLNFQKSPQLGTRRKFREEILKIQERANNFYRVSHNPLTHLLAREEFRSQLSASVESIQWGTGQDPELQSSDAPSIICVMALDIDHFKQINDTWGHLYGDQVLKTFARRLDSCASRIVSSTPKGSTSITLGHPSGEEFLILVRSSSSPDQFLEWANQFRKSIADGALPSEPEWRWLTNSGEVSISPPPLHERTVRTSIGVAFHNSSAQLAPGVDAVSDILDRADTALYRAKSGGRNQVTSYDDILSNCGRVIEQDQRTGVVAIDIGSNVGVDIGQEFKVYLPTFTGKSKFIVNDGRTRRTLGLYPRVEYARIVVFNSQPEISFAYIASPDNASTVFDAGSHLEAIPAGSIGHLLPSSSKYTQSISGNVEGMLEFIKNLAEQDDHAFAIVVKLNNESDYLRKYGSVSLNMALAQLYRGAQAKFHNSDFIELLDSGSVCIAGRSSNYTEELVNDFIEEISEELPELGILAGVFWEGDAYHLSADQSPLNPAHALEFARLASTDIGRFGANKVRHFSYSTVAGVLNALRESRSYQTAHADYERLRDLGVSSANISNVGGLIYARLGDSDEAFDRFFEAHSKDPSKIIYRSNCVTSAYTADQLESSIKLMEEVTDEQIDELIDIHPYGYFCYARALAKVRSSRPAMFNQERFLKVARGALAIEGFSESSDYEIISKTLTEIES